MNFNLFTMALLHRHRTALLLTALAAMSSYNLFVYFFTAYPFNVPRNFVVDPIPTRRALARKILEIQREIQVKAGNSREVDATWARGLLAVISELDPRVAVEEPKNSSQETVTPLTLTKKHFSVCLEVYKGRDYDPEHEHNFIELPCDARELRDVLTIVLSTKGWDPQRIERVIRTIKESYDDVKIVVLTFGYLAQTFDFDNVVVKKFGESSLESQALNQVIPVISTPFTFVTNTLARFNNQSPLKRLIRVLEESDKVNVVSGAYRDANGYWHHGCLQAMLENYELKYARGYEHSHHECMYCDDVLGPFMAKTDFLKKVELTETMEGSVMYRDWFLNVHNTRSLVMSCPDVMFFVDAEPSLNKNDWLQISQKWSIEHIQSFNGETFQFSCEEAQITCGGNMMKAVSSFLVPPCCRETIRKELGYVQDCAEEIGVHYELQAGSLLGAVKMDGMLPWDFDTDIISDCFEKQTWMSKGYECLSRKGCVLKVVYGKYWVAKCELSTVDINCVDNRTMKLAPEYRKTPTQIEFNGKMAKVAVNPGRTSRNYYGPDYLKHAVHWRYSSSSIIPLDDGSGQIPGLWSTCVVPAFHSCIDHFPVDGNVRFKYSQCKNP